MVVSFALRKFDLLNITFAESEHEVNAVQNVDIAAYNIFVLRAG